MNVKKNVIQMIEEKQPGWLEHVMHMGHEKLLKFLFEWESEGGRRRRRPRKTSISNVRAAMPNRGLTINNSLNRVLWRRRIFS